MNSSFGSRIPRNNIRPSKKKNPLGERVEPSVKDVKKNPLVERMTPSVNNTKQDPLGQRVTPSIKNMKQSPLGERVEPSIKDMKSKGMSEAMRRLGLLVSPRTASDVIVSRHRSSVASSGDDKSQRHGIAIIGRFFPWPWKQYPNEAYLADALESLGLRVVRISQDCYASPVQSVECALFTAHPASFSRVECWRKTHPTVVWAPSLIPGFPEYDPILKAARQATLFLSADQFDWKGSLGFSHHAYLPAACDSKSNAFLYRPEIPCAFVGSVYSKRRRQIVEIVRRLGGVVLDQMESWKYGQELSKFVQSVKVVVGDNARNDVPGFWSARNYIVPGSGGFLLTPGVQGLDRDFILGRELATYDSEGELESKIIQWITDNLSREAVRRAGYERACRDHTWEARAKSFLKLLAERIYVG